MKKMSILYLLSKCKTSEDIDKSFEDNKIKSIKKRIKYLREVMCIEDVTWNKADKNTSEKDMYQYEKIIYLDSTWKEFTDFSKQMNKSESAFNLLESLGYIFVNNKWAKNTRNSNANSGRKK